MSTAATEPRDMAEIMREIRELAATRRHRLARHMTGDRSLTRAQAGRVLDHLRGCDPLVLPPCEPETETPRSNVPPPLSAFKDKIPAGYYATPGDGETVNFWKVDVPAKPGKWLGYAFPKRVLGGDALAGEEMRTVDLDNMQKRLALAAILAFGLDKAGLLFAEKLTRCRDCGRFLTDEVSRADGRGPVCRAKH